jgi:hypothetical protein
MPYLPHGFFVLLSSFTYKNMPVENIYFPIKLKPITKQNKTTHGKSGNMMMYIKCVGGLESDQIHEFVK